MMRSFFTVCFFLVVSFSGNAYAGSANTDLAKSDAGKSASGEQLSKQAKPSGYTKEAESVYEKCTSERSWSINFDCECLAEKFMALRAERGPEPDKNSLVVVISVNGTCRNIPETTRMEHERCMRGSGFNYRGIPQKDYCECYAQAWKKLYSEYEGKIDEYKKSSLRGKARRYCSKPGAYKDK